MIYAMTFLVSLDDEQELEEWDCSTCKGYEAPTPFDAVKAHWGHCWLDDPGTDRERFVAWLNGDDYYSQYEFHVIGLDGSHWIVSFEVVPVGVTEAPVDGSRHDVWRRVIWGERNVQTVPASTEHAAAYPARWVFVTEEMAAAEKAADPDIMDSAGWWIHDFEEATK